MKRLLLLFLSGMLLAGFGPSRFSYSVQNTIHVVVALCDNQYQGIVPVPKKIGNGQDPDNNLYWGCGYGIRTYFKNSQEWKLITRHKIDSVKMERLVFKHVTEPYYLVADAYNGKHIARCTHDFFGGCSGQSKDTINLKGTIIGLYGNATLLAYVGHDGLMDFDLDGTYVSDGKTRDCIILACYSKNYFATHLKETGAKPLVWTTGLMCPEAYTLHDALSAYVRKEGSEAVRMRAIKAYAKFQKCGEKGAARLLVSGY